MAKTTPKGKPTKHAGKTEVTTLKLTPDSKRKLKKLAAIAELSIADTVEDLVIDAWNARPRR